MSDTALLPQAEDPEASLAALRAELDGIDDALLALLGRRAGVVARVGRAKQGVALRPGREAAILRRLLSGGAGGLPPVAVVRLWRELFAATTALQGRFVISVAELDPAQGFAAVAREQFGAATPLHVWQTPAQAIADLGSGAATAAVLPLPTAEDGQGAWWTGLLQRADPPRHVVARLPFWAPRAEGAPRAEALVLSAEAPDPSGADHTLIGLEFPEQPSRARLATAFAEAGLTLLAVLLRPHAGGTAVLATLDGFLEADDPRLAALPGLPFRPVRLGAYAVPVGEPA
jgi:chorismate mutase